MNRSSFLLPRVLLAMLTLVSVAAGQAMGTKTTPTAEPVDPVYEAMLEKIGAKPEAEAQVPLDAVFTNHNGEEVTLARYINGDRPVILNLLFFSCTTICNDVSAGLLRTMQQMDLTLGDDYDVLTISFDPSDLVEVSEAKMLHDDALERYGRASTSEAWPHLVGTEREIRRVTDSVAFHYSKNQNTTQYGHPAVIYVLTPQGKLSRYYEGFRYGPSDIKFSLMDASEGKVGSIWDHLSFFCLAWDPEVGQWVPAARRVMALGAAATLALLGVTIFLATRSRRASDVTPEDSSETETPNVSLGTQP